VKATRSAPARSISARRSTRIHGTNQPSTIGTYVSSGCIRLINEDVADLYSRVNVGSRVVVLPGRAPSPTAQNLAPTSEYVGAAAATGPDDPLKLDFRKKNRSPLTAAVFRFPLPV